MVWWTFPLTSRTHNGHISKLKNAKSLKWRSGKNPRAGKNIRKGKDGFDIIDDYFTESEADTTRAGDSMIEKGNKENEKEVNINNPKQVRQNKSDMTGGISLSSTSAFHSTLGRSIQHLKWRTGKDPKANKNIRKGNDGFDVIEDYFTESDTSTTTDFQHHSMHVPSHKIHTEAMEEDDVVIPSTAPADLARESPQAVMDVSQGSAADDEDDSCLSSLLPSQESADDTLKSTESDVGDNSDERTPVYSPCHIENETLCTENVSRVSEHPKMEGMDQGENASAEINYKTGEEDQGNMEMEKLSSHCNTRSSERRKSTVSNKAPTCQQPAETVYECNHNCQEDSETYDCHENVKEKSHKVTEKEELIDKCGTRDIQETASKIRHSSIVENENVGISRSSVRTENLDSHKSMTDTVYKKLRGQSVQRIVLESDDNGSIVIDDEGDMQVIKLSDAEHQYVDNIRTRKSLADRLKKRKGKSLGNVHENHKDNAVNHKDNAVDVKRRKSTLTGKKGKDMVQYTGWSDGEEDEEQADCHAEETVKNQKIADKSTNVKKIDKANLQQTLNSTMGRKSQAKEMKSSQMLNPVSQKAERKSQAVEKMYDKDGHVEEENYTDPGLSNSGEENMTGGMEVMMRKNSIVNKPHGKSVLAGSGLEVAGSNVGSITKLDDPTTTITPSFRTRKRLSYSAAELDENEKLKKRMSSLRSRTSVESIEEEPGSAKVVSSSNYRGRNSAAQKTVGKKGRHSVWLGDTESMESESSVNSVSVTSTKGNKQKNAKMKKSSVTSDSEQNGEVKESVYDLSPDKDEVTSDGGRKKRNNQITGNVTKGRKNSRKKSKNNVNLMKKTIDKQKVRHDKSEDYEQNIIDQENEVVDSMESPLNIEDNGTRTRAKQILLDSDSDNDIDDAGPDSLPLRPKSVINNEQCLTEHTHESDEKSQNSHQIENVGNKSTRKTRKSKSKKAEQSCSNENHVQHEEPPQSLPGKSRRGIHKGSKSANSQRTKVHVTTGNKKRRHTEVDQNTEVVFSQENQSQMKTDTSQRDPIQDSQTPVSTGMNIEDEEAIYKSGISVRNSRRRTINNLTVLDDLATANVLVNQPGPCPPKNRRVTEITSSLTPILSKGSSQKKNKRRVTISNLVTEKTYQVPTDTSGNSSAHSIEESSTPQSIAKRLSLDDDTSGLLSMNATPVHIYEVTTSESPVPPVPMPSIPKLIMPGQSQDGLRRSNRVRCRPVASYKGERVIYERRKSGFGIVGIQPSAVEIKVLKMEAERNRRQRKLKKGKKGRSPRRNLSTHAVLDLNLSLSSESECEVIDPVTGDTVVRACMFSKDQQVFRGPTGNTPEKSDPFIMTVTTANEHFISGILILRPLKEKLQQLVTKGSMTFLILNGKVSFTIHETTLIGEAEDFVCVPKGNTYSVKNLRREEAKLSFQCVLHD